MKLDVIIPCYNEEGNILILNDKIKEVLNNINYQIIYINDGSTDNTYNKLEEIYKQDKEHVKVINFSRNFGKDAAMYAGMRYSTSKYCAIIDSDMQQNPKYLLQMLNFLENNPDYDQVSMINKDRSNDNFFVKACAKYIGIGKNSSVSSVAYPNTIP